MLIITSVLLIASILPNIYPFTSELRPVVIEVTRIPIANAVLEIKAIAASPVILLLSLILKSRNADIITRYDVRALHWKKLLHLGLSGFFDAIYDRMHKGK